MKFYCYLIHFIDYLFKLCEDMCSRRPQLKNWQRWCCIWETIASYFSSCVPETRRNQCALHLELRDYVWSVHTYFYRCGNVSLVSGVVSLMPLDAFRTNARAKNLPKCCKTMLRLKLTKQLTRPCAPLLRGEWKNCQMRTIKYGRWPGDYE